MLSGRFEGLVAAIGVSLSTCAGTLPTGDRSSASPSNVTPSPRAASGWTVADECSFGGRMTVHFYDVGQALAVLVGLPDGRHVLVDAGDSPRRPGCAPCLAEDLHLLTKLEADLAGAPIDLVWITHAHSDHVGGVPEVLGRFPVRAYVDNGQSLGVREVRRARDAAAGRKVPVTVVDPNHRQVPMAPSAGVSLRAVVPPAWPVSCTEDPNDCSIGLRIDFCRSSVLFVGDAERGEEAVLEPGGQVTLLQVGHHGSGTSSSPAFLSKVRPRYAVISAGAPEDSRNAADCHPRALVVRRLTTVLGAGPDGGVAHAFDGARCSWWTSGEWSEVPVSPRLWLTERDQDVMLSTRGDGIFSRTP